MRALRHLVLLILTLSLTGDVADAQRGGRGAAPSAAGAGVEPGAESPARRAETGAHRRHRRAPRQFTQQMVDTHLQLQRAGFQEVETQRYVTDILVKEGFEVQRGVAGMPTSWIGRYGSGRPVIALGTDIDGLPTTNQTPGVVTRKEFVPGAPGPRRGPQRRSGDRRHRRARAQEDHGTREAARHDHDVAGRGGRSARREGALRPRRHLQGRRRRALPARRIQPGHRTGATAAATGWCRSSTRSPARARTPPARRGPARARSTPSS